MCIKIILTLVFSLASYGVAQAAEPSPQKTRPSKEELELEMTGFSKVSDTKSAINYNFRDEISFIISKERFDNQKNAENFCASQNSVLDKDFNVLLIAMSRAALVDPFLKEATGFKFKIKNEEISGIWAWSGKDNKIRMMMDGRGTSSEEAPALELAKLVKVAIPAVCSKNIQKKNSTSSSPLKDTIQTAIEGIPQITPSSKNNAEISNKPRGEVKEIDRPVSGETSSASSAVSK